MNKIILNEVVADFFIKNQIGLGNLVGIFSIMMLDVLIILLFALLILNFLFTCKVMTNCKLSNIFNKKNKGE